MKTKKYDLKQIYQKLLNDEIPQSYVDFVVSRCLIDKQASQTDTNKNMSAAVIYPKLYNKI